MAEAGSISSAIIAIFAWIVPHVGVEIAEQCGEIRKEWKGEQLTAGLSTVVAHSVLAVVVSLVLVASAAIGVALTTQNIDADMHDLLIGMSRIVAALMICFVSYKFPKWCGVYPSLKRDRRRLVATAPFASSATSLRVLAFHVRWSIWRHFAKQFFILLPFYCGVETMTIPVSVIIGCIGGALILLGVHVGTMFAKKRKIIIPISFALVLAALSAVAFSSGCYYIGEEWGGTSASMFESPKVLAYVSFGLWFLTLLLVHSVMLKCSARRLISNSSTSKHDQSPPASSSTSSSAAASVSDAEKPSVFDQTEGTVISDEQDCIEAVIEEAAPVSDTTVEVGQHATEPTRFCLARSKLRSDRGERDQRPRRSLCGHVTSTLKWLLWIGLSGFCLYLAIISIGSSVQRRPVSASLSTVQSTLYGSINRGPVCAFDNQGVNSTIKTFDSKPAANAAGFLVLHCGACAACSTWRNLQALWQSRHDVPRFALECGRETIAPRGYGGAVQCHMDMVGFDEACSTCWVDYEICSRDNCAFVYFQTDLIDHMAKFEPSKRSITLAECAETMCAAKFLSCSGASRIRMNVMFNDDDPRPDNQRCLVSQADWKELFSSESDLYFH